MVGTWVKDFDGHYVNTAHAVRAVYDVVAGWWWLHMVNGDKVPVQLDEVTLGELIPAELPTVDQLVREAGAA